MQDFVWYCAWIILPLIASIILFLAIPRNKATLNYATQGLEIKLSGAAALFFLLFFIMNPVKLGLVKVDYSQDWELVTSFKDEQNKLIPISNLSLVEAVPKFEYAPLDNYRVLVKLKNITIGADKTLVSPYHVKFYFHDYEPLSIETEDLNSAASCRVNWKTQRLRMTNSPALVRKARAETTINEVAAVEQEIK